MGTKATTSTDWQEKGVRLTLSTYRDKPLGGLFTDEIGARLEVWPLEEASKSTRKLFFNLINPFKSQKKARRRLTEILGRPEGFLHVSYFGPAAVPGTELRTAAETVAIDGRFRRKVSESWIGIPGLGGDLRVRAAGSGVPFKPSGVTVWVSDYRLGNQALRDPLELNVPMTAFV